MRWLIRCGLARQRHSVEQSIGVIHSGSPSGLFNKSLCGMVLGSWFLGAIFRGKHASYASVHIFFLVVWCIV